MTTSTFRGSTARKTVRRVASHLVLMAGALFFIFPLVFLISTSLKSSRQMAKWPPELIPDPWIWRNYVDVFLYAPMHKYLLNTIRIVIPSLFGAMVTSSLAAYAFARMQAPGRDLLFLILLSTMMLPGVVTLIPPTLSFPRSDGLARSGRWSFPRWLGAPSLSS